MISVESRVPGDVTKEKAELEELTVSRVKALNRFSSVHLKTGVVGLLGGGPARR